MEAYVTAYNHFAPTLAIIRFKQWLLALDPHSRDVFLAKCIAFIGDTSVPLRIWVEKCRVRSPMDLASDDSVWEELFAMSTNPTLYDILMLVLPRA